MNKPLVSVVMSEYNTKDKYLSESIDSVLSQTYETFEFIIVDDSHDQKLKDFIAQRYDDPRIKIVQNGCNKGFVYSLNNGISHSVGEYIMRMDTDDIIPPDRFERLVSFIESNSQYSVVSSMAVEFSEDKEFGINGTPGEKGRKEVMHGDVPVHAAAIIKKKDIEEIGLYKDYNRAEDLVLWCELLLAGKRLHMLDDVLYRYRVNPDDYKKRTIRHRKGEIKARLTYYPKLGAKPLDYARVAKSILAGAAPMWLIRFYRNKVTNKRRIGYEHPTGQ